MTAMISTQTEFGHVFTPSEITSPDNGAAAPDCSDRGSGYGSRVVQVPFKWVPDTNRKGLWVLIKLVLSNY